VTRPPALSAGTVVARPVLLPAFAIVGGSL